MSTRVLGKVDPGFRDRARAMTYESTARYNHSYTPVTVPNANVEFGSSTDTERTADEV